MALFEKIVGLPNRGGILLVLLFFLLVRFALWRILDDWPRVYFLDILPFSTLDFALGFLDLFVFLITIVVDFLAEDGLEHDLLFVVVVLFGEPHVLDADAAHRIAHPLTFE